MLFLLVLACTSDDPVEVTETDTDTVSDERAWTYGLPALEDELTDVRGLAHRRAIVHLHSAWSHDACDGQPLIEGEPNQPCMDDLRAALCATRVNAAFLTEHPSHAATAEWDDLFHRREGDSWSGDDHRANIIHCDNGHDVRWMFGIEDELMPVALAEHVADTPDERSRIYNQSDVEAVDANIAAGGTVLIAHSEGRELAHLEELQDLGLAGMEVFNLHAMFAPDIRQDDLGLSGVGWVSDIEPFTNPDSTGEPDLLMLGVLQHQPPSLEKWDTLLARGPMVGVAGTDAHQNVMPLDLRDGERVDSYRRMLRWFSNHLLVDEDTPEAYQAAIDSGRMYVAFEILGTPAGFDFWLDDGTEVEMGGTGDSGTLHVTCPALSETSPRGLIAPELTVRVLKDGSIWQSSCGDFETNGPGVYRVEIEMTPRHLLPFLGETPDVWLRPFPWIYGNAIRVQ
jgi:hypothetical protein